MSFDTLQGYMDSLVGQGIPGAAIAVWQDHRELFRCNVGARDAEGSIPVSAGDFYWLYSATKVITCAGALILVERGLLDMESPVANYLPAWSRVRVREGSALRSPGEPMLVRHLFAMQGGLNYNLESPAIREAYKRYGGNGTTRQTTDAIAKEPLDFDPGTRFQYSLCHDILGAVIESVSGQTLGAYLRENIFIPCGMDTATFRPTKAQLASMTWQYTWDEAAHQVLPFEQGVSYRLSNCYESGGAGLACRVDDYIRFADTMAMGGVARTGKRILKPETIDWMRTNQQHGQCLKDFWLMQPAWREQYGYGLGVRVQLGKNAADFSPEGDFGWDGAAGSFVLMNPSLRLSVFYAMQIRNCDFGYAVIHQELRRLAYEALGVSR